MSTKYKIITGVVALLVAFASGRFLAPTKVVTVTHTVEVEKKTENKDSSKHYVITKHETDKPDGSKEITTTKTEQDNTTTKIADQTNITQDQTKTITRGEQKVTLSALGGIAFSGVPKPIYGGSLTKPVLGPITIGVWGLSNATFGASVGLTF